MRPKKPKEKPKPDEFTLMLDREVLRAMEECQPGTPRHDALLQEAIKRGLKKPGK